MPHLTSTRCPTTAFPAIPWNVNCSTPNVDLDARLSLFSQWRGAKGNDGAGLWHLMSNCPTGSEVGIAWLGTLCQVDATTSGSSMVSGTAVSTAGLTEWQVISHEMGHNFGAIVRPFYLDTNVFSDELHSTMCVLNRTHTQLLLTSCVHSVPMGATVQLLAAR
jgi:hypothetical protein